jgi:ribonuclease P protein component
LSSRSDQKPEVNGHKECKHYTLTKYGLQKTEKLKQSEIRRLFSKGSRFSHKDLVIIYRPGENRKVGFVASKGIGGAVKRNRTRRILREAYRMNKDIFKGLNVIFYARGHCDLDTIQNILTLFKEQH